MSVKTDSDNQNDRRGYQNSRLPTRYWRLLLIVTLPIFFVVVALVVTQYRDQHTQILQDLAKDNASYTIALENIAKLADDHVKQMNQWHVNYFDNPHDHPSELRTNFTPRFRNNSIDGYSLDNITDQQKEYTGQVPWISGSLENAEEGRVILSQALEFFSLVRLTHSVTSHFQWSYFFSSTREYTYIYPWASSKDLIDAAGYNSIVDAIGSWFTYDIYKLGTPAQNPTRASYWTDPYIDAGGTGAMVSHGAPVYINDKFEGIVGTDISLVTLEQFLLSLPRQVGRLLILDLKKTVLADSHGSLKDAIRNVNEIFPEIPIDRSIGLSMESLGNPIESDNYVIVSNTIEHAPWSLVYIVSEDEIANLLTPRFLPYGVIMVVLAITFLMSLYVLRRQFIRPAFSLVDYIHNVSRNSKTQEPKLPHLWQPWANVVTRTFKENREASRKLSESENRFQQILNNSTNIVCVRNLSEQFILVNHRFEKLFSLKQEDIVGKTMDELLPETNVEHMRETDLQVIKCNDSIEFEENVYLPDGKHSYISTKFPLHDSDGNIYAICTVSTDITRRKHTEEVIRQTALGISESEAKGNDLFSSLVVHLAHALDVEFALIGLLQGKDEIRTKALVANGQLAENITYPLAGSPCENVVGQQFRFYPDNIQGRFPEDELLTEICVESYAAIPLFDRHGGVMGLLAILDKKPLQDRELIESVLQIFSGRATTELEREKVDLALRASEASYRSIFESSPDAIFIHDIDSGAILDVNPTACSVYGYTAEEMRHIDVGALSSGVPPYTLDNAANLIGKAVKGELVRFEWHRKNKDGTLHWDEVLLKRASIGGTDRIVAFTREITKQKFAVEKLRASEEQYRAIFNASSDTLILWDSEGNIVDNNRSNWMLRGYTQEEFTAIPLEQHIHPSSLRAFAEFKNAIRQGEAFSTEGKAIGKDGQLMELEVRGVPMIYQGKPHVLTIIRDITEQKKASEELARQRNALHQNEKLSAMGALVANVAHELNNPLAILMGRAALLENKLKDDPSVGEAHKIRVAADRCGRIVRTFLNMARQRPAEHTSANLNDVISNALELLGYALKSTDIYIEKNLASFMPNQQMDADQIGQVIVNLLVNAQQALSECKYPRKIEIKTGIVEQKSYLLVADNGPGVDVQIRDRIFDPFFTTKPEGTGTGVGLAVSRSIMRAHQGDLCLEKTQNGAAFRLWLPLETVSDHVKNSERVNHPSDITYEGVALVVDDEPEISSLIADILKSAGFSVKTVSTGKDALDWLKHNHCDFILSDIRMPDLDGPGLLNELKLNYPQLAKHIAFITGDTLSAGIAPFLEESGLPWLEKPFSPEQVLELVVQVEMA